MTVINVFATAIKLLNNMYFFEIDKTHCLNVTLYGLHISKYLSNTVRQLLLFLNNCYRKSKINYSTFKIILLF